MATHDCGLTDLYNRFHHPEEASTDIQKLRQLHIEMDNAVVAGYGWTDLDLDHGFHETKQGVRYTISETARLEVLARLLKLNHERYPQEVKQGLHDSKAKRATAGAKQNPKKVMTKTSAPTLFDIDTAFPSTQQDKLLCGLLCDLVAQQPGLTATAYLDAMVIALRPNRPNRLLIGKDRTQFTTLAEKLPGVSNQTVSSIPWSELVDLLTQQGAILKGGTTTLGLGRRFEQVRTWYPACEPKLIQLIHKAATTLREFQSPDQIETADIQQELSEFNEDKHSLRGANP